MHARTHVRVSNLSDSSVLERVFGSRVALRAEDIICVHIFNLELGASSCTKLQNTFDSDSRQL